MKLFRSISLLLLSSLLLVACSKFTKIEKSKDINYKLTKADEFYANKKYRKAQTLYEALFPAYKGSDKFEELYYKWANTYYLLEMYPEAQNFYKGFLETFPNSKYAEEVDFQRAYSYYKQSPRIELEQVNTIKAMGQLQTFINQHPNSSRVALASETIDLARAKLEQKDFRAAKLFYDIGHYRAASIAFGEITNNYPESTRGDEYFNMVVKANYRFAKLSAVDKQLERYEIVVRSYQDFQDRYPESKLLKDAEQYNNLSLSQIKEIYNEQVTSSVKL